MKCKRLIKSVTVIIKKLITATLLSPFVVKSAAKRTSLMLPTSHSLQRHPVKGFQQVCPFVLAQHFCLLLLTRSPPRSLDWYHPIATALAVPTLVNKVLIPACWLRLLNILWRLSTHAFLVKRNHTFGDPRFQNGSLTSNNPHHHMLVYPTDKHRHQITQCITSVSYITAGMPLSYYIGAINNPLSLR